ncbi:MAG: 3-deoxy-7-phosphoheptulonate synthase [Bacillota bacterium]|jgi:3-deoxy-7-phosphoheptulonate synthase
MIVVMAPEATESELNSLIKRLESAGLTVHLSRGQERTVVGVVGDVRRMPQETLEVMPGVERVIRIQQPFKLASREYRQEPTVIDVSGVPVGGEGIVVMAGPCSIESRSMLEDLAHGLASDGASVLRGGAFKPRTSPYSFQGLGVEGLKILRDVGVSAGLPVITEVISPDQVSLVGRYADILQIGARNMQNFTLLQEAGKSHRPVLLKRGMSASVEEWLQAADYVLSEGNPNVILCERGIRTFESYTRFTLDLSAVPVLKKLSHLPVIVDPSHGTGRWELVSPMAAAAIAAGADGLLIEVHPDPERALSDGPQSLKPPAFREMVSQLSRVAQAVGRSLVRPAPSMKTAV